MKTIWHDGAVAPKEPGEYWLCMKAKHDFPNTDIKEGQIHIVSGEWNGYGDCTWDYDPDGWEYLFWAEKEKPTLPDGMTMDDISGYCVW